MKGIIFQLLEDVVVDAYGEPTWDELLDATGLDGAYTSLGSYDDAEITALVAAAATKLSLPEGEVLRWFGQRAIPGMAKRWPEFFTPHQTTVPFLLSLNDVIHPEVRKLYAGASCPHFHFHDLEDGRMGVAYQSPRQMCWLAHGFVEGAADHYGDTIEIEHLSCMLDGNPVCRLALRWVQ